jgi:hypothetical protein
MPPHFAPECSPFAAAPKHHDTGKTKYREGEDGSVKQFHMDPKVCHYTSGEADL